MKVSVVVPVYNPGPHLEQCIASLLQQSLPDDEYEVVFVDDGSTDGSGARLDRLAAQHPHVRVLHEEPSGWAGRPRNVGTDASRGEYVMYVDADDWLAPEALARMHAYGRAHDADIVVGKMAGRGRAVPRELFRRNRPRATLDDAPLIDSLTAHKMFRAEFLRRHGLRFPEGRRRLEDHVFVTEAYLLAGSVAVLADYVCYHHERRAGAASISGERADPVAYHVALREVFDVVERHTAPGALRDKLLARWLRNEMLDPLRGRRLLALPESYRAELFAQVRATLAERIGPGSVRRLQPVQQVLAGLVAGGTLADVEDLARFEAGIRAAGRLQGLARDGDALLLDVEAELRAGGRPLPYQEVDGRELLDPPLAPATRRAVAALDAELAAPADRARLDVVVREHGTAAEFFLPVETTRRRVPTADGGYRLLLVGRVTLDPATAAKGAPLGPGLWELVVRLTASGWTKEARLRAPRGAVRRAGAGSAGGGRTARPRTTVLAGTLYLDVAAG